MQPLKVKPPDTTGTQTAREDMEHNPESWSGTDYSLPLQTVVQINKVLFPSLEL